MQVKEKVFLTVKETAEVLNCDEKSVRAMCENGRLKFTRVGRRRGNYRILLASVVGLAA